MAYTSKYTGAEIDANIGKIPTLQTGLTTAQSNIDTINNTHLVQIRAQIDSLSTSLDNLNSSLKTEFVGYTIYNQKIAEINSIIDELKTSLNELESKVNSKVGYDVYTTAIADLEKSDSDIKDLISAGDQEIRASCEEKIAENKDRITATEASITTLQGDVIALKNTTIPELQNDVKTLKNTTIPELQNSITTINDTTIPQLNNSIQTIANDYITAGGLETKSSSILTEVSNIYATQSAVESLNASLSNLSDTLTREYITKADHTTSKQQLENKITTLSERVSQLENQMNNKG